MILLSHCVITELHTLIGYFLPTIYRGICSNLEEDKVRAYLEPIMEDLAYAYLEVLKKQKGKRKEFFGLRDFYRYCSVLLGHAQPMHLISDKNWSEMS